MSQPKASEWQRFERYSDKQTHYQVAIITDEDQSSKIQLEDGQSAWHSRLRIDEVARQVDSATGDVQYHFHDLPPDDTHEYSLVSLIAEGDRGAEFSELVQFGKHLLTFDDRTGLVCEVRNFSQLVPRQILMTGSGDEEFKGFKSEWATLKDNHLYIGSHGKRPQEEWIKVIGRHYGLQSVDWHENYQKIREAAGVSGEGYIIHEAAEWHPVLKKWLFFPRKLSNQPFDPEHDERECGNNRLFICSEDFSHIQVIEVGQRHPERGVSSIKLVPGRQNECIGLKSVEIGDRTETYFFAFDLTGRVLQQDTLIGHYKCEGIEIL